MRNSEMMEREYISPEEAGQIIGVKAKTIRAWLKTGKLLGVKLGRIWSIPQEDFKKFLQKSNPIIDVDVDSYRGRGHYPGYVRQLLIEAIEETYPRNEGTSGLWTVLGGQQEAKRVLGKFWFCTDAVPTNVLHLVADILDSDEYEYQANRVRYDISTYSQLSRVLLRLLRNQIAEKEE